MIVIDRIELPIELPVDLIELVVEGRFGSKREARERARRFAPLVHEVRPVAVPRLLARRQRGFAPALYRGARGVVSTVVIVRRARAGNPPLTVITRMIPLVRVARVERRQAPPLRRAAVERAAR